jgi:hypothetical protein
MGQPRSLRVFCNSVNLAKTQFALKKKNNFDLIFLLYKKN